MKIIPVVTVDKNYTPQIIISNIYTVFHICDDLEIAAKKIIHKYLCTAHGMYIARHNSLEKWTWDDIYELILGERLSEEGIIQVKQYDLYRNDNEIIPMNVFEFSLVAISEEVKNKCQK